MIFDRNGNAYRYESVLPGITEAVGAACRIESEERDVCAGTSVGLSGQNKLNFCEFTARPANENALRFEAHRKYADVMIVTCGAETVYFTDLSCIDVTVPYDDGSDILFGETRSDPGKVILSPGFFAVFEPADAHAPGFSSGDGPVTVKKTVAKIAVQTRTDL